MSALRKSDADEETSSTKFKGGVKKGMFKAIAVATDISPPASPCGMCRQFIREFCDDNTPIWMFDKDGKFMVMKLGQVCEPRCNCWLRKTKTLLTIAA